MGYDGSYNLDIKSLRIKSLTKISVVIGFSCFMPRAGSYKAWRAKP